MWPGATVLGFSRDQNHFEGWLKHRLLASLPELLIQQVWGGA